MRVCACCVAQPYASKHNRVRVRVSAPGPEVMLLGGGGGGHFAVFVGHFGLKHIHCTGTVGGRAQAGRKPTPRSACADL